MAARVARELQDGECVNLGIGIPTLVANYITAERRITVHSENGLIGMGPAPDAGAMDEDIVNAGGSPASELAGSSYVDSAESFAMVRGGHVAVSVLGAMQVSQTGDLANWAAPGAALKGMGGAMDLVAGVRRVIALMEHNDRSGAPKLLAECTLPLTGQGVVDLVVTELGVFEIDRLRAMVVARELAAGVTFAEVERRTAAAIVDGR